METETLQVIWVTRVHQSLSIFFVGESVLDLGPDWVLQKAEYILFLFILLTLRVLEPGGVFFMFVFLVVVLKK